jgi:hypothetical protein
VINYAPPGANPTGNAGSNTSADSRWGRAIAHSLTTLLDPVVAAPLVLVTINSKVTLTDVATDREYCIALALSSLREPVKSNLVIEVAGEYTMLMPESSYA